MKTLLLSTAMALTAVAAQAQTAPATSAPATSMPAQATPAAEITDAAVFTAKAASSNMFEIEEGKAALTNSQNADIKAFAQKMIDDHSKAGDAMKTAADKQGVPVPPQMNADDRAKLDALKSAPDFDKTYVADQVAAHDSAVTLFANYAKDGGDGALKQFAADTLPTLKQHQDMIHKIAGQ